MNRPCLIWVLWAMTVASCPSWGQRDLDSLDAWVRSMAPAPFIRCGEDAWLRELGQARQAWDGASPVEKLRVTNRLLRTLEDSHSAISTMHWIWDVEKRRGTIPLRWAIEGRALWVMDSGVEGLPAEVRVLALNGIPAEDCVAAAIDLAPQEGQSTVATARAGAHNVTCWVLEHTQSDTLQVHWLDPQTMLARTSIGVGVPLRKAAKAWAPISTRRPVVDWTFPDGTGISGWDDRRKRREARRLAGTGHAEKVRTTWPGVATLKISSFSDGGWGKYHRRLWRGFFLLEQWNVPLVIDLRSNAGGQSPRMESLWRHVAKEPLTLPHALVAKQSQATLAMHRKVYRGLRKRWVNKHRHQSEEAAYIYDMANLALGEIDTLTFRKKSVASYHQKGPMALIMDGESASATVSFAGAFQTTTRGPVLGEACMGPAQGTMGNPFLVRLPDSGIHVSLSTAIYMAQDTDDWAASETIQPDFPVGTMWRSANGLDEAIRLWKEVATQTRKR